MTPREIAVVRAVLLALRAVPATYLLDEPTLRADAARLLRPGATAAELDAALRWLDGQRRIEGIVSELGTAQWQITDQGRLWLARHP